MLTERGNIESIHFVDGCIMQRGREIEGDQIHPKISGIQRQLQWGRPGHGRHNHCLQLVLSGFIFFQSFFYTNHVFSVGSLVPDIQRPVVLLPPPLLAEHGGGAHEVLWQGNHYKVHIHQYH